MDQLECITKSLHRKGAHLTFEERVIIQTRLRDGWSPPQIAKEIGCAPNTVRNEIRRGNVLLYNEKHEGYRAVNGQDIYEANRENCGRTSLHQERRGCCTKPTCNSPLLFRFDGMRGNNAADGQLLCVVLTDRCGRYAAFRRPACGSRRGSYCR